MGQVKIRKPPIPREEPEDDDPPPEAKTTVRPPAPEAPAGAASSQPSSVATATATYQALRESCRVEPTGEDAELDHELAVEAEVLRVALDRKKGSSAP